VFVKRFARKTDMEPTPLELMESLSKNIVVHFTNGRCDYEGQRGEDREGKRKFHDVDDAVLSGTLDSELKK
jgi:hypothetical protein